MQAKVQVGYSISRPIIPDEAFSTVVVSAHDDIEAELIATQMVASRDYCEMPTSSKILEVVL